MDILCYSVRLQSLTPISPICYKAVGFDGSSDLIPAKFIFGNDAGVVKSDAYWIAAWILEKKHITYSRKKAAYFSKYGKMLPKISVKEHTPEHIDAVESNEINELYR